MVTTMSKSLFLGHGLVRVKQSHNELLYNSDLDSGDEPITIDNALAALHKVT